MAETALDVVSLSEIKAELRIPSGDDSRDGMLSFQIGAAVSWVERLTYLPLVDRQERLPAAVRLGDDPILLDAPFIRTIDSLTYWTPDAALRDEPDGTVASADLGRTEVLPDERGTYVWPPASGWPAVRAGTAIRATITRGLDLGTGSEAGEALKAAVILRVRDLLGGYRDERETAAARRILEPWRYLGIRRRGGVPTEVTPTPVTPTPVTPPVTTHSLYALVTADSATPTAAEFLATTPTTAEEIEVPAHGAGYLHFADTRSSLSEIEEAGSAFGSRAFFSDSPTPLSINGVQHYVYSSKGSLFAHNAPQVWELIS